MAIYITCNKKWFETSWAKTKLGNIMQEASRKRIPCHVVFSRAELLKYQNEYLNESSCLVVDANGTKDEEILKEYEGLPLHTVMFIHHIHSNLNEEFSYVMSDLSQSLNDAFNILKENGCKYPVLFGDRRKENEGLRIRLFKELDYSKRNKCFLIEDGKLSSCMNNMLHSSERIDSIICTDDFQAIRLMKVLDLIDENWQNKISIISFTNTQISSLYLTPITSGTIGYEEGGKAIVSIHENFRKNQDIKVMHIILKTRIEKRNTTSYKNPKGIVFKESKHIDLDTIRKIIEDGSKANLIELILQNADKIDIHIISSLLHKKTTSEMAIECYCSPSTIKYRLKNMKTILKVSKNSELIDAYSRYINIDLIDELESSL